MRAFERAAIKIKNLKDMSKIVSRAVVNLTECAFITESFQNAKEGGEVSQSLHVGVSKPVEVFRGLPKGPVKYSDNR